MSIKIDQIIRSKRKTIALVVTSDAKLIIRSPEKTPIECLNWLVEKKKGWIHKKKELAVRNRYKHAKKRFVDGEGFMYLSRWRKLAISDTAEKIRLMGNTLYFPAKSLKIADRAMQEWYKHQAGEVIRKRVAWFAELHGLDYKSIRLTDAKKRWGSCGPTNSLNFSWRLVMAPMEMIDYVVVHELCHTVEKNHTKNYWVMVKTIIPDYRKRKEWLEKNQQMLDL
jgi:predicted metal-dependent hydrolase